MAGDSTWSWYLVETLTKQVKPTCSFGQTFLDLYCIWKTYICVSVISTGEGFYDDAVQKSVG